MCVFKMIEKHLLVTTTILVSNGFLRVNCFHDTNKVVSCPETYEEWYNRSEAMDQCSGRRVYHCLHDLLTDEDTELCLETTTIGAGNCPVLEGKSLYWKPCNTSGCPRHEYRSDEIYQYVICYREKKPIHKRNKSVNEEEPVIWTLVGILCVLAVGGVVGGVTLVRRRRRKQQANQQSTDEKLPMLSEFGKVENTECVRTKFVADGLHALEMYSSVVLIGILGNAVSSTSLKIIEDYLKKYKDWQAKCCGYTTNYWEGVCDNTLLFIDGLFGTWNDNPCELKRVKECLRQTNEIIKTNRVKVIIGIRSDIYNNYFDDLETSRQSIEEHAIFDHNIHLDDESYTRHEEQTNHFKNKIGQSPCMKDDCACKALTCDDLISRDKNVGVPLKIEVLANYHSLISDFLQTKNLLATLINHFNDIKEQDIQFYNHLMHPLLSEKTDLAEQNDGNINHISADRDSGSMNADNMQILEKYLNQGKSNFWHPFIYICAFHSLYQTNPDEIIRYGNIDAILQLVRPIGKMSNFTTEMKKEQYKAFYNARIKDQTYESKISEHPLHKAFAEYLTETAGSQEVEGGWLLV